MSADVLKEFLVSLGWKNDEAGQRRMMEALESTTKRAVALGAALTATATIAIGVVQRIAAGFEQLHYASDRIGASAKNINTFKYAVSQLGGTAEGAMQSLESFGRKLRENREGVAGWLKNYGVNAFDATGQQRDLTAVLKELVASKTFDKQAYNTKILQLQDILGVDERTYRALNDPNRKAFEKEIEDRYKAAGLDPKKAAEAGKQFEQVWRSLGVSIDIIKDKLAIAMTGEAGRAFTDLIKYLDAHSGQIADGLVSVGTALVKAATWIAKLVIGFAEFGEKADPWIKSITGMDNGFATLAATILLLATLRIPALIGAIATLIGGSAWKALFGGLAALGLPGAALAIGGLALGGAVEAGKAFTETDDQAARNHRGHGPIDMAARGWRWAKKKLGFGGGGEAVRPPGAAGTFRPTYKLGDKDLSDAVVNTIAGEAIANNQTSVDAVINNMFNRLGTKGWGPSGNLEEVARAKGQYEGYRRAGAQEAEFIRSRIRAIASGGVPDNTNGSNSYRAAWYSGPWARRVGANGIVVGGNRFAYDPAVPNGPYAPYKEPHADGLPPGARWVDIPGGGKVAVDKDGKAIQTIAPRGAAPGVLSGRSVSPRESPYGALAPAGPIGGSTTINSRSFGDNIINQKQTFNVTSPDPGAAARSIAGVQTRTNADLVRNLQGSAR